MGIKRSILELGEAGGMQSVVTLRDGRELYIENCRCVKSCDDNLITVSVRGLDILITGAPLMLESFGSEGVKISGRIHSLTLEEC